MATSSDAAESLSGSCRNLLDPEDFYFNTSTGTWQTTNGTSSVDFSFRFKNQYHTLKVTPSSSSQVTLQHEQIQLPSSYKNDFITFYGRIYCESKVTATVTVTSSYGDSSSVTTVLNALTWGIVRGPEIVVPPTEGNTGFTTTIQIVNHNNSAIYLAHPVLTNTYAIRNNLFLRMCMERMPVFFIEKDSEQTAPNFPMLRLMDVGLAYAGKAVDELDSFPYLDIDGGYDATDNSTKSSLVEPQVANKEFLPWLAQIVGTKLSQSAGGSTPWGNLPTTWASFVSLIDDPADGNATADWDEIESYDTSDNNFVQGRRDQITTARIGHNAGTKTAIIESAQTVLTGTKTVNYIVDPIVNPWTITLETYTSETPGGVVLEDSETVINAVEKSRPMGFTIQHICKEFFTPITCFEVAPASQEVTRLWAPSSGVVEAGANLVVYITKTQSDGRILVGGGFTSFNNIIVNCLIRLNSDGSLDNSFTTGTGFSHSVSYIAIQSDGKILVGGSFTTFNGTTVGRIVRLNSDGTLDTTFTTNTGTGFNGVVEAIEIQSDGKIVVGGQFTTFNGTTVNYLTRLNSNGSLDTDFDTATGAGFNYIVSAIKIQSDGKIVVGGYFTTFDGTTTRYLTRLNSGGSLDTDFVAAAGTGFINTVFVIQIQSDGKILVGGGITSFNGTTVNRIARLNSDGSLDTAFTTNAGTGFTATLGVYDMGIQSDGKIVVGGNFTAFNDTTANNLVRLNSNGSLDTSFIGNGTPSAGVQGVEIQSSGKIIIGGTFVTIGTTITDFIARLNSDGSLDEAFIVANTGGLTAADGVAIGTGAQNTIDIIADTGGVASTNASAYCADLVYGGYSDWFLPSKDEFAQLRIQREAIGDLQTGAYWTSTEYLNSSSLAWTQRIDTGSLNGQTKTTNAFVRPVRSFLAYRSYTVGDTGPSGGKIFIVQA
jgi:uncharacterized delta-60 repeat protein